MNEYVAWLHEDEASSAERVGGKGASLARLAAAGFPVPPGFALTVDAYRRYHREASLDELVAPLSRLAARPPLAEVRQHCAPILERLAGQGLPSELAPVLRAATQELLTRAGADATLAVRSSGVSEDGASASFAGLYDSYLNLRDEAAVLDAIERCYRCLWEPRAAHYRAIRGIDQSREAMAVVVMQTVRSAASGVAFSLNPVSGADDEVVISASWGLGEAIVSGLVTPDNYVAAKDGSIRKREIAEKAVRVVGVEGGTEKQEVPGHLAWAPALSDDQAGEVARAVVAVETQYGCPVDVEFAYDGDGRLYLLQARPITTR